uniref:Ribonuclease E n=1 Tax=Sphondylothamnion multifidum TaxID=193186 RepID=A0A4D6WZ11_9FLOR|nr:ribonuclease E [Sphondylothamnion multifidum]
MIKKIVISHFNNVAAILQNNKIEEIVLVSNTYQVNDIYIGIVQKIFSSINAAFIKLGRYGKSGFIHISDIKHLKKNWYINHIHEVLSVNQIILVQVVKEPTFNKGPRLTANIHLHGKYVALMPFCNTISISHKIYDDNERIYLYSLALLIKPYTMGLLIKTSAQGISEKLILSDLNVLKKQWNFIEKTVISTSCPVLVYRDEDLIKKVVRDFYEDNIKKIIIDSEDGLKLLYYYLNQWNCISPISDTKLQLYNKSECILDDFFIKQAIKDALKPKIKLLYGGYIIIESYEALTIIDVNSGSFNRSDSSKEAILKTNFYAAIEIAYQLKFRNINGVIIVDFIDMYSNKDQLQLLEHFNRLLKYDNSKPQIVQFSELGLVELTRRRRGQSLQEVFGYFDKKTLHRNKYFEPQIDLLISDSYKYSTKQLLIYKNIRLLFFAKKFKKKIALDCKKFSLNDNSLYSKYFISFDQFNRVNLFHPRANYIVPLVIYLKYI